MDDLSTPSLPPSESILIAAFEGWNDAGSAASAALDHLGKVWGAQEYAAVDPDDYHDFQVNRPLVSRLPNGDRVITWPGTVMATTVGPFTTERRISLVRGIEPSMRWRQFCTEVLELAEDLEVTTIITCGALLVDVPHTRPFPTFLSSEDPKFQEAFDIGTSEYDGPTGIVGVLGHEAQIRGIKVLSMWVGVPHYVAHPPSPKATMALLSQIERVVGEPIDLGDLPEDAEAWTRGADELAEEDDEIEAHIRQLETVVDELTLPEASGEAIAAEFEQFLRRRDGGTGR